MDNWETAAKIMKETRQRREDEEQRKDLEMRKWIFEYSKQQCEAVKKRDEEAKKRDEEAKRRIEETEDKLSRLREVDLFRDHRYYKEFGSWSKMIGTPQKKQIVEEVIDCEEEIKKIDAIYEQQKRFEAKQKERELVETDEAKQCVICCERGKRSCYYPCGHQGCYICLEANRKLVKGCHICRKEIKDITELYD